MERIEQVDLNRALEAEYPLTQAVRIGNLIFVSGQIALDREGKIVGENDLAAQCKKCFENLGEVLEAAGATFKDLVKLTSFFTADITDPAVVRTYFDVREAYLGSHKPASSGVQVKSLIYPGLLLEMDAIAVLPHT